MLFLVLKAYLNLIHFDIYIGRGCFAPLYEKVRTSQRSAGQYVPFPLGEIQ
jgi:hypothetical protein